MRVPRDDCGICLMGDRIIVVGGYTTGVKAMATVEVYNPKRDEWTEVSGILFPSFLRRLASQFGGFFSK